ncbi:hypothetical protein BJ875DRAFT_383355 [Amylocarpus encephaloides]|uniref:FAD-binding PCMH-type domain-containing protein n=1 Tax=Amylocarpus encephaloides TaxID=45428 RepID=A0A9P8C2N5_9HELO|nr:hypothetical protein BJ875DRAFT_383355 [Amylocarpus encephaloides]
MRYYSLLLLSRFLSLSHALSLPFENNPLPGSWILPSSISRGPSSDPAGRCKVHPGDENWPSDGIWRNINEAITIVSRGSGQSRGCFEGSPPGSVCYPNRKYPDIPIDAAACDAVQKGWANSLFNAGDPVSANSHWTEGNACTPEGLSNSSGKCDIGAFPAYVADVTNVVGIEVFVQIAAGTGSRIIIKNTGHDFLGRSTGAGSFSIWTQHLKGFEYNSRYVSKGYTGPAAIIGAGMMSYEVKTAASQAKITVITPGGSTVGVVGGYFQGGGHGIYTSLYGMAADNVLSVGIVLANGTFIRTDADTEPDLFWAVRGGGGGNWGIVTSITVKAYPLTPYSSSSIAFTSADAVSNEAFWAAVKATWRFGPKITDAGGIGYNFIRIPSKNTYNFSTGLKLPFMTKAHASAFTLPIIKELISLGINITNPIPTYNDGLNSNPSAGDLDWGQTRQASRLIPRANFEDETLLEATSAAIRKSVEEGGYVFHAIHHQPKIDLLPRSFTDNAVHPEYRTTGMHAQSYDILPAKDAADTREYRRFRRYFQEIVDAGGREPAAYMNEADVGEPGFQRAFYGKNYERLLRIKKQYDPDGLFWVETGVGSEGWRLEDRRLCKVGS